MTKFQQNKTELSELLTLASKSAKTNLENIKGDLQETLGGEIRTSDRLLIENVISLSAAIRELTTALIMLDNADKK